MTKERHDYTRGKDHQVDRPLKEEGQYEVDMQAGLGKKWPGPAAEETRQSLIGDCNLAVRAWRTLVLFHDSFPTKQCVWFGLCSVVWFVHTYLVGATEHSQTDLTRLGDLEGLMRREEERDSRSRFV